MATRSRPQAQATWAPRRAAPKPAPGGRKAKSATSSRTKAVSAAAKKTAKKSATARSKTAAHEAVARKAAAKKSAPKRPAPKTAAARPRAVTLRAPAARTPKTTPAKAAAHTASTVRLGRPKVTGDEKLYLLFKEDFPARQIFTFLGVETVRDLERYAPQEIVALLTQPIAQTVDRIRQRLAALNRHLADDQQFALQFQQAQRTEAND